MKLHILLLDLVLSLSNQLKLIFVCPTYGFYNVKDVTKLQRLKIFS